MQIHYLPTLLPAFKNAVVTIGTFDGVHTGHQQIIAQLKNKAIAIGGETVLITFHPHPRTVLGQASTGFMLNSLEERLLLLESHGIDHVVVVPFTNSFATQLANNYIHDFLWKLFKPHTVIIGYDHHFGKDRMGNYKMLETYGAHLGFEVQEISEEIINDITISSTRIRKALQAGNIPLANTYLGYPYFFSGQVVKGNQLGRTIGFPTANLQILNIEKLLPKQGVYAVMATVENHSMAQKGMMNMGYRPTVDGKKFTIEVHLFDFDVDIYDEILQIQVMQQLRSEQKFEGLEILKKQLHLDKLEAQKILETQY